MLDTFYRMLGMQMDWRTDTDEIRIFFVQHLIYTPVDSTTPPLGAPLRLRNLAVHQAHEFNFRVGCVPRQMVNSAGPTTTDNCGFQLVCQHLSF